MQVDIVRLLRPDGTGLTVVGDDAQAIFRVPRRGLPPISPIWPPALPGVTVVRLDRNFRSPPAAA